MRGIPGIIKESGDTKWHVSDKLGLHTQTQQICGICKSSRGLKQVRKLMKQGPFAV